MVPKKAPRATEAVLAAARQRAEATRRALAHKPPPSELLTPQEQADAAPFYFVLREYIRQLKEARDAAGLTLADLSARTGMAVEYLSRLETGAQTNPTWKTLGAYAKALGRRPQLSLTPARATAALIQNVCSGKRYVRKEDWKSASISASEPTLAMAGCNG